MMDQFLNSITNPKLGSPSPDHTASMTRKIEVKIVSPFSVMSLLVIRVVTQCVLDKVDR